MTETRFLARFATIANAAFNSMTANSTAITSMSIGGAAINATSFAGTANNASNLGGIAAASYQLNSALAANVATMTANNASNLGGVAAASYALLAGPTFTGNTTVANLAFSGTGTRITGDFSNATVANRVMFQSSTTNGNTQVRVIPNGTGTLATLQVGNSSDPNNQSVLSFGVFADRADINSLVNGTGTFLPLSIAVGGSERMRIDTSGRVGIGTSSPTSPLEVSSTSQFSGIALTGTGRAWGVGSSSTAVVNINYQHDAMAFTASGTERMRITADGNVGIGTTPNNRLDVAVPGASTGVAVVRVFNSTDGANAGLLGLVKFGSTAANYGAFTPNSVGVSGAFTNLLFGTETAHPAIFYTSNVERMRITSDGNVGIGTLTPSDRLTVNSAIGIRGSNFAGINYFGTSVNLAGVYTGLDSAGGFAINVRDAGYQAFSTNNTERMRIDASGNVGIGTSTPSVRLEIAGVSSTANDTWAGGTDLLELTAASGSAFSEQAIAFQEVGTNVGAKIGVKNRSNGAYDIIFANRDNSSFTSTMTERMRIRAGGNVGIGTSSPSDPLDVNGNVRIRGNRIFQDNAGAGNSFEIGPGAGSGDANLWGFYAPPSREIAWFANANLAARITTAGAFQFNSGYGSVATAFGCRAWVNFNGTGTIAIRGSGNVSSITDNGTGDYTINFTAAMPDDGYTVIPGASVGGEAGWKTDHIVVSGAALTSGGAGTPTLKTTSAVRIRTGHAGNQNFSDLVVIELSIFR